MTPAQRKLGRSLLLTCLVVLVSEPAHALRCGTRLVKEGMLESQVIAICGEPASRHELGYVLRPYIIRRPAGKFGMRSTAHVHSGYYQELLVTELMFNFGPRKLIRILRFEGNRLTSIKTAGYGYIE